MVVGVQWRATNSLEIVEVFVLLWTQLLHFSKPWMVMRTTAVHGMTAGISGSRRRFPSRRMTGFGEAATDASRNTNSSHMAWVGQWGGGYKRPNNKTVPYKAFSSYFGKAVKQQLLRVRSRRAWSPCPCLGGGVSPGCCCCCCSSHLHRASSPKKVKEKRYGEESPQTTRHLEIIC